MKLFRKDSSKVKVKKKRTGKEKAIIIFGLFTVFFAIASLAAFRGITYLSDCTYLISKKPFIFIGIAVVLIAINAWLWVKKKTKQRIILSILSMLSLISLIINTVVFSNQMKNRQVEITTAIEGSEAIMDGKTFMAGAAKGDITPTENMMPMPLLFVLKFDKVVDPVYTRVLALSDGTNEALYITLDMTLVPETDETLDYLSEKTGIARKNIFISATHTHGVTPVSLMDFNGVDGMKVNDWYGQIKETLLKTVKEARSNMVPARYGYGTGYSEINVNRDLDGEKSVLGSNFDRPSDKTIRMARIESTNGDTIALVVNYACHSVVVNGALHAGIRTYWTDDLAGNTSRKIEKDMDGAVVLYSCGASGDQNPALRAQYGGETGNGIPSVKNLGNASFNVLEYLSEIHSRDILRANENIVCTETEGLIYTAEKTVSAKKKDSDGNIDYTLRLFKIGNIMFQGIDAEVVTSIGQAVMDTSPYENTILVTLANGYKGYCADDWEFEHDAFEVGNTKSEQGAAQKAFVEGFKQMFSEEK
jgi:Predicted membrane protein